MKAEGKMQEGGREQAVVNICRDHDTPDDDGLYQLSLITTGLYNDCSDIIQYCCMVLGRWG